MSEVNNSESDSTETQKGTTPSKSVEAESHETQNSEANPSDGSIEQLGFAIHQRADDEPVEEAERYYVAKTPEKNGEHAIHTPKCPYFPQREDRFYLGKFSSGSAAAVAARAHYRQISGCYYCSEERNTRIGFGRRLWNAMTLKKAG